MKRRSRLSSDGHVVQLGSTREGAVAELQAYDVAAAMQHPYTHVAGQAAASDAGRHR